MFRVDELVNAIGGVLMAGTPDRIVESISTDTRRLVPGALFWALPGERFDSLSFVGEALAKGACGAVIPERGRTSVRWEGHDAIVIAVRDTVRALQDIAAFHRSRFAVPVVGLTGSNGKTTTKEMATAVLERLGPILSTQGNLNNHLGVPLTLLGLTAAHRAAIVEMGINHPGELTRLCEIARPTVALITNVGYAHLEGFGGIEGVARAKGELFRALGPSDTALVNVDDPYLVALVPALSSRVLRFGLSEADVTGRLVEDLGRAGTRIEIRYGTERTECLVPIVGPHNAANAVAAAAIGVVLGCPLEDIGRGLARARPTAMRSQLLSTRSGILVFNDAYNANPSSMRQALGTLWRLREAGRLYAVLGDMLELGASTEALHREVGALAARVPLDGLVAVGRAAQWVADGAARAGMAPSAIVQVETAEEAVAVIAAWARPGDVVFIKGSRRMGLERVAVALGAEVPSAHS